MKLGQLIAIVMNNISWKNSTWLGGLGPKSRYVFLYQPNVINQKLNMMILWFFNRLKVCTETIKLVNIINQKLIGRIMLFHQNHLRAWN